jgi:hypothetical protein
MDPLACDPAPSSTSHHLVLRRLSSSSSGPASSDRGGAPAADTLQKLLYSKSSTPLIPSRSFYTQSHQQSLSPHPPPNPNLNNGALPSPSALIHCAGGTPARTAPAPPPVTRRCLLDTDLDSVSRCRGRKEAYCAGPARRGSHGLARARLVRDPCLTGHGVEFPRIDTTKWSVTY